MPISIPTSEDFAKLMQTIEDLRREQAIQALVVNEFGWIPQSGVLAMKIPNLTSYAGISAAVKRGDLVQSISGKKPVSAKSLIAYLHKVGYSLESIQERIRA